MIDVRIVAMRMLGTLFIMGALGGAYSYQDMFGSDPVYPIAPEQARATLAQTEIPQFIFGSADVHTVGNQHGDGSVVWTAVEGDDRPTLRFVAKVTSSGKGSRIHLDIEPAEGAAHSRVAQGIADNPQVAKLYKAAMAEQIDATFNHRKFDMARISQTMATTLLVTLPQLSQQMSADGEAMRKEAEATVADAARHQTAPSESAPEKVGVGDSDASAPQVDPNQPR